MLLPSSEHFALEDCQFSIWVSRAIPTSLTAPHGAADENYCLVFQHLSCATTNAKGTVPARKQNSLTNTLPLFSDYRVLIYATLLIF